MLGRKNRDDISVVYLAYAPYIRRKKRGDAPLRVEPRFHEIQAEFFAQLLKWCLEQEIVQKNDAGTTILPKLNNNIASLSYNLHTFNFQTLVYEDKLDNFLNMLKDNTTRQPTTSLQQLTISLLGLYDPDFIHYHINRTYCAFMALPLENPDYTWMELHRNYPFLWVLLSLHLVLRNYVDLAQ